MKKFIATLALVCVVAGGVFGQTDGMLNLKSYTNIFLDRNRVMDWRYIDASSDEDFERISALGGDLVDIDTPLEIALLTICAGVVEIRPAEANRMLGNARQADQKLGAAVFQEIQILRFLGDTAAVNRHEAVLQYITDRKNVTHAEIETYYRNNIRGLVSQVVDENIAKSRFGKPTADALTEIKNVITQFFLSPTLDNLLVVRQRDRYYANTDGDRGKAASDVLVNSVVSFNPVLAEVMLSGSLLTTTATN